MKTENMKAIVDSRDSVIGDGSVHADYKVFDFSKKYPQIVASVSKSLNSESVYVYYRNKDNGRVITCRFSWHENNATRFGDELIGGIAEPDEVLFHLGLKTRTFIPKTKLFVPSRTVSKKDLESGRYEEADKTINEIYEMGAGADISQYNGKLAKGSNYLILGNKILEFKEKFGTYIYEQPISEEDYTTNFYTHP